MILGFVVLMIAGAAAVGWGLRGRRLGDHVHCRKCGYDLTGLPDGVVRCSECGTDLREKRATTRGVKTNRVWAMVTGLVLMIMPVGAGWFVKDWTQHKPAWWLQMELEGPRAGTAFKELARRLESREIWQWEVRSIVEKALGVQQDRKRAWDERWGELVESAIKMKMASQEQIDRYQREAFRIKPLRVRAKVRRGQSIPVATLRERREWHNQSVCVELDYKVGGYHCNIGTTGGNGESSDVLNPGERWNLIGDGTQYLQCVATYKMQFDGPIMKREEFSLPFEVVREPTVSLRRDQALRDVIEKSFDAEPWSSGAFTFTLMCSKPPMPLMFSVAARDGEREVPLGCADYFPAEYPAGTMRRGRVMDRYPDARPGHVLDIVLRPTPDRAAGTVDVTEIWGGEVVIKGVKVPPR